MPDYETMYNELKEYNEGLEQTDFSFLAVTDKEEGIIDTDYDFRGEGMELAELDKMWEEFGNVPVDEDDCIDESFYHFENGTQKEDVWYWFEEQNSSFCVGKKLYNFD